MKVVVIGSGVVGVTTAYHLSKAGHEVTVVDRREGPGLETSFANAGQVSVSYASPWAAPNVPVNILRWMLQRHAPLVLRPKLDLAMWRWLLSMLGECRAARYRVNKERLLRLARYSQTCLARVRAETGVTYDQQSRGMLQLFRDERSFRHARAETKELTRANIVCRVVDWDEVLRIEPGLRHTHARVAGGVHFPVDETGDAYLFTRALATIAEQNGVVFRYGTTVRALPTDASRVSHLLTDRGTISADTYIVAAGSYSPLLLRPLGVRLPVYPVKGYSATFPLTDTDAGPTSTLTDERYKVAITRLGNRLRAAGIAEVSGYGIELSAARLRALDYVVGDLFPRAADMKSAVYWTGLRPMTPDNVPILGPTPYRNLYLNTGHGTLGWTLSNGSARVLADLLTGRTPEVDLTGLTLARYGQ
ncbi:MAG: D-amino acid dehydrogenase [Pseudomonadota bacterium]|nr:MAG: D-amino acid dehydrogenase [Pseudomonadota bacterium]